MLEPVVYYRDSYDWASEKESAEKYFHCTNLITELASRPSESLIIGRYSLWPHYKDTEREFENIKCKLINTYAQHQYIADMKDWVIDLQGLTPETWSKLENLPEEGPFVLKGSTNSKKNYWNTCMFAKNKKEAIQVHSRLCEDSLISYQDIYIRKYIPLKTYIIGIQGLPITKEFRFFVCYGKVINGGFYWSNYIDDISDKPDYNEIPQEFLQTVIDKVKDRVNFFVVDVAQTVEGEWIVIELNDGQQSGLSCNDADILYANLRKAIDEKK